MIDPGAVLDARSARHILRRTGFGAPRNEVSSFTGLTRGQAADRLLAFPNTIVRPGGSSFRESHDRWVKSMVKSKAPLQQKLVLFWHDHFAVGYNKVGSVTNMAGYVALLHRHAKGNFRTLLKAMNRNAAMLEFLDTARNEKSQPNENYARELLELFTLGVHDLSAAGLENYRQADVVQIARAFTGWGYEYNSGLSYFEEGRHDYVEEYDGSPNFDRGPKVIFETVGGFGPAGRSFVVAGEGAGEIDAVIDILLEHLDSDGHNTTARRIARRLCEYFAHPEPTLAFVDEIISDSEFDSTWNCSALLRSLLVHDDFYATAAGPPYQSSSMKSVRWPIDFAVSTLRLLQMRPVGGSAQIRGGSYLSMVDHLDAMGQLLMEPPSVFGWDWETGWISSGTLLARCSFARDVVASRYGSTRFRPEALIDMTLTVPGDIVDAVLEVLGVSDQIEAGERQVLIDYLSDDGARDSLDLAKYEARQIKLTGLFALVLQSPAYQLH